ncbi:FAD synthetase family protein [Peribacillus deserti]|uniref:FAD synthetase family protein n=1 Tax=Peribacillus deserti TaxID=673318 RepID=UPI0015E0B7BC|nr:FAD synthetase family protein [Peribacillus deserti]
MEVIYVKHPEALELAAQEPHVMAIGFFDGVHLGHQSLLNEAKRIAKKKNHTFTAMTFDPHPNEIIKFEKNMRYITPLPSKIEKLAALGVERLFIVSFDLAFASLSPSDFIDQYVLGLQARQIVVGFDFTFGRKAQGTIDYLNTASKNKGFDVTVISKKTHNDEKISSTMIRKQLRAGKVQLIPDYLGQLYEIKGSIQLPNWHNSGNESSFGFIADMKYMLPAPGTYHVEVLYSGRTIRGLFSRKHSSLPINSLSGVPKQCLGGECTIKFLSSVQIPQQAKLECNLKEVIY